MSKSKSKGVNTTTPIDVVIGKDVDSIVVDKVVKSNTITEQYVVAKGKSIWTPFGMADGGTPVTRQLFGNQIFDRLLEAGAVVLKKGKQ